MKRFYVGNLPWSLDSAGLRLVASDYGKVVDARVIYEGYEGSGRSRGFGFVEFDDEDSAARFRAQAGGRLVMGRDLRIKDADVSLPRRGLAAKRPASFDR